MGGMDGDVFLAREWSWGAFEGDVFHARELSRGVLRATCFLQGSGRGGHGWRRVSCKGVVVGSIEGDVFLAREWSWGGMDGDVFLARGWSWGALRATCFLQGVVVGGMYGDVFLAREWSWGALRATLKNRASSSTTHHLHAGNACVCTCRVEHTPNEQLELSCREGRYGASPACLRFTISYPLLATAWIYMSERWLRNLPTSMPVIHST